LYEEQYIHTHCNHIVKKRTTMDIFWQFSMCQNAVTFVLHWLFEPFAIFGFCFLSAWYFDQILSPMFMAYRWRLWTFFDNFAPPESKMATILRKIVQIHGRVAKSRYLSKIAPACQNRGNRSFHDFSIFFYPYSSNFIPVIGNDDISGTAVCLWHGIPEVNGALNNKQTGHKIWQSGAT